MSWNMDEGIRKDQCLQDRHLIKCLGQNQTICVYLSNLGCVNPLDSRVLAWMSVPGRSPE